MKKWWDNPLFRFIVFAFGLYVTWFFVYDNWLQPAGVLDGWVIEQIVYQTDSILNFLGYQTQENNLYGAEIRTSGIVGSDGVWIGDSCNGITLSALFLGFVLAFPGPIKKKLWFIPLGLITVHFLNVLRVTALAIISYHSPESLDFNHTYTFTILVYSYVFLLWYIWADKLSGFGQKG